MERERTIKEKESCFQSHPGLKNLKLCSEMSQRTDKTRMRWRQDYWKRGRQGVVDTVDAEQNIHLKKERKGAVECSMTT